MQELEDFFGVPVITDVHEPHAQAEDLGLDDLRVLGHVGDQRGLVVRASREVAARGASAGDDARPVSTSPIDERGDPFLLASGDQRAEVGGRVLGRPEAHTTEEVRDA